MAPLPRLAQPLVEQARLEPSLRVRMTGDAAQLNLNTGATGSVMAQLRISDGVADVRISGEAAGLLARHTAELSLGLAANGVKPGHLEILASSPPSPAQGGADAGTDPGNRNKRGGETPHDPETDSEPPAEVDDRPSPRSKAVHVEA